MLIGLAGKKRVGKDTAAKVFAGRGWHVDSFAAPLRALVEQIAGPITDENKERGITWLGGKSRREMMQTLGTEWGRQMVHPEIWVRSLLHRVRGRRAVITDLRFENEAEAIRKAGGIVVHITRPSAPTGDKHPSEAGIQIRREDFLLTNDGSVHDFVCEVEALLDEIEGVPWPNARSATSTC